MPAPSMWDSAQIEDQLGDSSKTNVAAHIVRNGGQPELDLTPSMDWLQDPARVYPVTIDPVIDNNSGASSTYVESDLSNPDSGEAELRVGEYNGAAARSYLRFPSVTGLPGEYVQSASLNLWNNQVSTCQPTNPMYVTTLSSPFSAGKTVWSTKPTNNPTPIASSSLTFAHGKTGCGSAADSIDVTAIARAWAGATGTGDGAVSNYGLQISAHEASGAPYWWLCSFHYTSGGTTSCNTISHVPHLVVTYSPPGGGQFTASQGRVLDTRSSSQVGQYGTPMPNGVWRSVQVSGNAGVPATGVNAVQVLVTALSSAGTNGTVSLAIDSAGTDSFPALSFNPSSTATSSTAVVQLSATGGLAAMSTASADLTIDVRGYYTLGTSGSGGYVPTTPIRIASTQDGTQFAQAHLLSGSTSTVHVDGYNAVPSNATAAFVNITVSNYSGSQGQINIFPTGAPSPSTPVSFPDQASTNIGTTVPLSSNGAFSFTLSGIGTSGVDVIVDQSGYFTPSGPESGFSTAAVSLARNVNVASGSTVSVPVAGVGGVPLLGSGITAVALRLTGITTSGSGGYMTVWQDSAPRPNVSSLNFAASNVAISNFLTSALGQNGAIQIYNSGPASAQISLVAEGWYSTPSAPACSQDITRVLSPSSTADVDGGERLSALFVNYGEGAMAGEIYVTDAAGNDVGSSPTASASTIESGTRIAYDVPANQLTPGTTYSWHVSALTGDTCGSQDTSPVMSFVAASPGTSVQTQTTNLVLSGSSLTFASAATGPVDCNGAPCALTSSPAYVGQINGKSWMTSVKADVSSIPSGSQVVSATLKLSQVGCVPANACNSDILDIGAPSSDVAAAANGSDLANLDKVADGSGPEIPTGSGYDVTNLVAQWIGAPSKNFGMVLVLDDQATATQGIQYQTPSSTSTTASLQIDYVPPSIPGSTARVTAQAGDAGAVLSWPAPADTGYADNQDQGNSLSSYTVAIADATGHVVQTASVTNNYETVTGLVNGQTYTATVAAVNPIGTGAAVSSASFTPTSNSLPTSTYTTAIQSLVDAETKLTSGSAQTSASAISGEAQSSVVSQHLDALAGGQEITEQTMAASGERDQNDATTLSENVAVTNADGTVTLFTTQSRTNQTYDTSDPSDPVTIDGSEFEHAAYTFAGGSTPTLLFSATTADALPATQLSGETATSPNDQAADSVPDPNDSLQTDPNDDSELALAQYQASATGTDAADVKPAHTIFADKAHLVAAAKGDTVHGLPGFVTNPNDFGDDCTDFVSRMLNQSGFHQQSDPDEPTFSHGVVTHSLKYWFYDVRLVPDEWSETWSFAQRNYEWQKAQGTYFLKYLRNAQPGYLVYAAWRNAKIGKPGIDHMGIVTAVHNHNVYITQHSHDRINEPLWGPEGSSSWQGEPGRAKFYMTATPRELTLGS